MEPADPAAAVRQSMDHEVAAGGQTLGRGAINVVLFRIRNVQGKMVVAVRFVKIDRVNSFRRALIAFEFLCARGRAAECHRIAFQSAPILKQRQATCGLLDENSIGHGIVGQGIYIQISSRREAARHYANNQKNKQQQLQFYSGSAGSRARGSRSFVVAVLGSVTNGPPSSGALSENATSGMLLGNPSSGNSFRRGK